MAEKKRKLSDDMKLADLTVGEFKQLMHQLLSGKEDRHAEEADESPLENIKVRRKSLDEFMNDLGEKK